MQFKPKAGHKTKLLLFCYIIILSICNAKLLDKTIKQSSFYFNGSNPFQILNISNPKTTSFELSFQTYGENGTLFQQMLSNGKSFTIELVDRLKLQVCVTTTNVTEIWLSHLISLNAWTHVEYHLNSSMDFTMKINGNDIDLFEVNHTNHSLSSFFTSAASNWIFGNNFDGNNGFHGCFLGGSGFEFLINQTSSNGIILDCPLDIHRYSHQCNNLTCSGNSSCIEIRADTLCICGNNSFGYGCQLNGTNPCLNVTCFNGGLCVSNDSGIARCQCQEGFTGEMCNENINECFSNPCKNGGQCFDLINSYNCSCDGTGFTGRECTEDINECENNSPCLGRSTCLNRPGSFVCVCEPGFSGQFCDIELNECDSSPCLNGAICEDMVANYSCRCLLGYKGHNCEHLIDYCNDHACNTTSQECKSEPGRYICICKKGYGGVYCVELDECSSNPCLNGATCQDQVDNYVCICPLGYTGLTCASDINECSPDPCHNGAECVDQIGKYTCNCTMGWTGKNCSQVHAPCNKNPCHNGATCRPLLAAKTPGYQCICADGFSGLNCDVNIDDCVTVTCAYNELCVDGVASYECECNSGYTRDASENCTVEIDECATEPCVNGTCVDLLADYFCNCTYGYEGRKCDNETDFCLSNPCQNNGICHRKFGSYECSCLHGHVGVHCEVWYDPCFSNPCGNGGTCHSIDANSYTCHCAAGFAGDNCQIDIDECLSNPCVNGNCTDAVASYNCTCDVGWHGHNCDVNIDECASDPCSNAVNCTDQIAGYRCHCVEGFTGSHCTINIDECEDDPCLNNGTCVDGINSYSCNCDDTGYNGTHCDVEVDECSLLTPCENGGTCLDLVNDFRCLCYEAYSGERCEIDEDDCLSQPCHHNGTCIERSDQSSYGVHFNATFSYETAHGFVCICAEGYHGDLCAHEIDECATLRPCASGSTCVDLLADYLCLCPPNLGGKTCSVTLRGCDTHQCARGSLCRPYLENEYLDIHNYTCQCDRGFTGRFCDVTTAMSFIESSRMLFNLPQDSGANDVSVQFRTTLSNLPLFSLTFIDENVTLKISINDGRLDYFLATSSANQATYNVTLSDKESGFISTVNDDTWHSVSIKWQQKLIYVNFASSEIVIDVQRSVNNNLEGDILMFGGGYIGCIRDVTVGPSTLSLNDAVSYDDVTSGCNRSIECHNDSCSGRGACIDLWTEYRCICTRPYVGSDCNFSLTPSTFSYMDTSSFAQFQLPSPPVSTFQLSAFIKTREPDSFFLSTTDDVTEDPNATDYYSVVVGIQDGKPMVSLGEAVFYPYLQESGGVNTEGKTLSDGKTRFISIHIDDRKMSYTDDETTFEQTLPKALNITTSTIYVGLMPKRHGARTRRSSYSLPPFKGAIQDLQFNGFRLLFSGKETKLIEDSGTPNFILPFTAPIDVKFGLVSDPVCNKTTQPCQNGGVCDVTFNDYVCNCTPQWKGRNCNDPVFCKQLTCPGGMTCLDLPAGGFECQAPITIQPNTTFRFSWVAMDSRNFTTVSFRIKTRSSDRSILHLSDDSNVPRVVFRLDLHGNLAMTYGNVTTSPRHALVPRPINDGAWHDVELHPIDSKYFRLTVDSQYSTQIDAPDRLLSDVMASKSGALWVGISAEELAFKGCLVDLRIGGFLLPFYDPYKLTNHTAAMSSTPFYIVTSPPLMFGCHGDDVCREEPCQNNGTCVDEFNKYRCVCRRGFTSSNCDVNIDNCVGVTCSANGTCLDQVDGFRCLCFTGYHGENCELETLECASSPCLNNATCRDLIGSFRCECGDGRFEGERCQINASQSCGGDITNENHPCVNGGSCRNVTEEEKITFACECPRMYTGSRCESAIDPCEDSVCVNNSTCVANLTSATFTCACAEGYTGATCQHVIGRCTSAPCQNGGSCVDRKSGFRCLCPKSYTGFTCNLLNNCTRPGNTTMCENDGECLVNLDKRGTPMYTCNCTRLYAGNSCQFANPCLNATCHNGGTCVVTDSIVTSQLDAVSSLCQCTEGFSGPDCSETSALLSSTSMVILIAAVGGAGILLLVVLGVFAGVSAAMDRRSTSGTYSPSKQEATSVPPGLSGLESEMWTELKPPPKCERLI